MTVTMLMILSSFELLARNRFPRGFLILKTNQIKRYAFVMFQYFKRNVHALQTGEDIARYLTSCPSEFVVFKLSKSQTTKATR